jgi:hypothetical protein
MDAVLLTEMKKIGSCVRTYIKKFICFFSVDGKHERAKRGVRFQVLMYEDDSLLGYFA